MATDRIFISTSNSIILSINVVIFCLKFHIKFHCKTIQDFIENEFVCGWRLAHSLFYWFSCLTHFPCNFVVNRADLLISTWLKQNKLKICWTWAKEVQLNKQGCTLFPVNKCCSGRFWSHPIFCPVTSVFWHFIIVRNLSW